eukprot:CAMPEP_0113538624 /NCGR_PEP_ID=MMETSP0015_2-20120614/7470_1 /TAXON_ID=2838 /ORGANISM="Odontella" /LENGTH=172 /DNA_ID=CAMNT_0000438221 /DNA_START=237 /DNA_END=755 /DNA_ORIENTATION=+ /assembly_acc=CAM_ASM_000160
MGRNRITPTAQMISEIHQKDQYVGLLKPWVASSTVPIDENKEYFCVATWGTMHLLNMPKFARLTSKIGSELHNKETHGQHLVGETRQVCNWGLSDFRAETFTVWHEREYMAKFYKSGAHRNAMTSMKDDVDFRVRRVWVKGGELPRMGDSASTREFVSRIKSGGFPEAVKKV